MRDHNNANEFSSNSTKGVTATGVEWQYFSNHFNKFSIPRTILVIWKPSPSDWLKLNIDVSVKENLGLAFTGGLVRNHNGEWLLRFQRLVGVTTSLAAEIRSIRDGLQLISNQGWSKVEVETDSKLVIDLITNIHAGHLTI